MRPKDWKGYHHYHESEPFSPMKRAIRGAAAGTKKGQSKTVKTDNGPFHVNTLVSWRSQRRSAEIVNSCKIGSRNVSLDDDKENVPLVRSIKIPNGDDALSKQQQRLKTLMKNSKTHNPSVQRAGMPLTSKPIVTRPAPSSRAMKNSESRDDIIQEGLRYKSDEYRDCRKSISDLHIGIQETAAEDQQEYTPPDTNKVQTSTCVHNIQSSTRQDVDKKRQFESPTLVNEAFSGYEEKSSSLERRASIALAKDSSVRTKELLKKAERILGKATLTLSLIKLQQESSGTVPVITESGLGAANHQRADSNATPLSDVKPIELSKDNASFISHHELPRPPCSEEEKTDLCVYQRYHHQPYTGLNAEYPDPGLHLSFMSIDSSVLPSTAFPVRERSIPSETALLETAKDLKREDLHGAQQTAFASTHQHASQSHPKHQMKKSKSNVGADQVAPSEHALHKPLSSSHRKERTNMNICVTNGDLSRDLEEQDVLYHIPRSFLNGVKVPQNPCPLPKSMLSFVEIVSNAPSPISGLSNSHETQSVKPSSTDDIDGQFENKGPDSVSTLSDGTAVNRTWPHDKLSYEPNASRSQSHLSNSRARFQMSQAASRDSWQRGLHFSPNAIEVQRQANEYYRRQSQRSPFPRQEQQRDSGIGRHKRYQQDDALPSVSCLSIFCSRGSQRKGNEMFRNETRMRNSTSPLESAKKYEDYTPSTQTPYSPTRISNISSLAFQKGEPFELVLLEI